MQISLFFQEIEKHWNTKVGERKLCRKLDGVSSSGAIVGGEFYWFKSSDYSRDCVLVETDLATGTVELHRHTQV